MCVRVVPAPRLVCIETNPGPGHPAKPPYKRGQHPYHKQSQPSHSCKSDERRILFFFLRFFHGFALSVHPCAAPAGSIWRAWLLSAWVCLLPVTINWCTPPPHLGFPFQAALV